MSIGDYAGELSISLRTDAMVLNTKDSERFLEEFLERLRRLVEMEVDLRQVNLP
jgi:hypothetical protein